MTGFFYGIQNYFRGTYSGRYLAHLLAELFRRKPGDFAKVLKACGINYTYKRGDTIIANGWRFPATAVRFADIAILNSAGGPLVLIEIKDADIKNVGNSAQLEDYLKFICRGADNRVDFLFLSRSAPPERENLLLKRSKSSERVHQMRFGELYRPLKSSDPLCQMLRDYLEDINVVYHDKKPDVKTLEYVTRRMLDIGGRQATEKSVPEFFNVVFGNLLSIGQWLQNNNLRLFKQGFKRRVYVQPWHDVKRLQQVMESRESKSAQALIQEEYLGEYCKGGEVDFYTSGYLTYKKTKAYLEFGYWFKIEKKPKKSNAYKHSSGLYAQLAWAPWSGSHDDLVQSAEELKSFPSEETFQKDLRKYLSSTKAAILKRKKCPKGVKQLLQQFKVP